MTSQRDDDALGWAGDDDPTLVSGPEPTGTDLPEGWSVAGPTAAVDEQNARIAAAGPSSVALIALGLLGGVYLLYTIGWFIGVSRIGNPLTEPLSQAMFSLGLWLAVAAPIVWFGTTYWLTRSSPRARIGWLVAGALLLAPLPFILGTGGAS
ncbi:MAG TPA: DNA polymerase III subunit gamma/tau [Cryobacterium sp.]|nr:DNA polymerase III subunit gamma/tau [Cryobacterium sp.]